MVNLLISLNQKFNVKIIVTNHIKLKKKVNYWLGVIRGIYNEIGFLSKMTSWTGNLKKTKSTNSNQNVITLTPTTRYYNSNLNGNRLIEIFGNVTINFPPKYFNRNLDVFSEYESMMDNYIKSCNGNQFIFPPKS